MSHWMVALGICKVVEVSVVWAGGLVGGVTRGLHKSQKCLVQKCWRWRGTRSLYFRGFARLWRCKDYTLKEDEDFGEWLD